MPNDESHRTLSPQPRKRGNDSDSLESEQEEEQVCDNKSDNLDSVKRFASCGPLDMDPLLANSDEK